MKPPDFGDSNSAWVTGMPQGSGFYHPHGSRPQSTEPSGFAGAAAYSPYGNPPPPLAGLWPIPVVRFVVAQIDLTLPTDFESSAGHLPQSDPLALRAQTGPPPTETLKTSLASRDANSRYGPEQPTYVVLSPGAYDAAVPLATLNTSTAATTANSTATVLLRAHDTALQDFSSQQLLLAATTDGIQDSKLNSDTDADDPRQSLDRQTDESEALADSNLSDDVAVSLDTLRRERKAIDQVLAELHDLRLLADDHGPVAAHAHHPADSEPVFTAVEHRVPADQPNTEPPPSDSAGGMVLLQASGDADSSAYDLTAVLFSGAEKSTQMATDTEAAVGVYQAFDVSAAELRTTHANDVPRGDPVTIGQGASADRGSGA
jgi:hypothetical protein